jgi:ATP-dependent Clp protease ATP-binding subunit ClpA
MFDKFSMRSKQVLFVTRWKAGRRGANALDVGDLISAIIVEDQEMLSKLMGCEGQIFQPAGLRPHTPFFSESSASDLLASIEGILSRSNPIPDSTDLPITRDLQRIFKSVENDWQETHHKEIEPLHLLAAVLEGTHRPVVDLLNSAGITKENVRARLKEL